MGGVGRFWKPAAFGASIFAMAGLYQAIWTARPDYFRVSADVNFLPLDLIETARQYSPLKKDGPLPELPKPPQESTIEKIKSIYQNVQKASMQTAEKQRQWSQATEEENRDREAFQQSMYDQVEEYVASKGSQYRTEVERLDVQLKEMLDHAGAKSSDALPAGTIAIAYSQLAVVRAKASLELAKSVYEARDYSLKHLTEFQQKPEQKAWIAKSEKTEQLRQEIFKAQQAIFTMGRDLYDTMQEYRLEAYNKLTYWDFVYFSVGAATTATFGDIAPNHKWVRILVCAQVIFSVVIVGLTINQMAGRAAIPATLDTTRYWG